LYDAGHDCRIYVPHEEAGGKAEPDILIQQWAAEIVATKPDCVGFSTMCISYPLILLLAKAVKHLLPNTCIVLGGPQATAVAEESLAAFPWIDYVVRGEAESAILEFVHVVANQKKPHETSNLTYRTNGKILSTPLGPLLNDLDSLALPDYRAYPLFEEALIREDHGVKEKFIPLEAGRGCPYGCCFCSTSSFWHRRRRQKSPDLLVEQIKSVAHKYKIKALLLMQDLFATEGDWLVDFLHAMEGSGEISWCCALRPDSVSAQTLAKMRRVGCGYIFFGVESGSQRVQKLIGKNLDISKTRRTIEAAVASGIRVKTSFIVGFPWETADDLQDTLSLHKHFLDIGVEASQVFLLSPLPKTQITTQYASQLRFDPYQFARATGLKYVRNDKIDRMIRQYPQIFSSFYYVNPEFLSRREVLLAADAANALSALR
jgi:radical SAM superfamily enzyme YgiQ (UPF0313 family)